VNAAAEAVVCRGAPRDLGFDQGAAVRARLRADASAARGLSALVGRLRGRAQVVRADRDIRRFFPHMAERMAGLARGAGVPRAALVARLVRATQEPSSGWLVAADAARTGEEGALLARAVAGQLAGLGAWIVRRSEPDHDHHSVEVAPAAGVPALAGVNEHGLAAAATHAAAPPEDFADCAAPAELLVQDCLQRFDTVEKAVEWCVRRPAGGRARILLADAAGGMAAVDVEGTVRRVLASEAGVLLGLARGSAQGALGKAAAARPRLCGSALAALLAEMAGPGALRLLLDPHRRRLGLLCSDEQSPRWLPAARSGS
jgi:hypothetical protein